MGTQDPLLLLVVVAIAILVLMACGVHVAAALALPGIIGFLLFQGTTGVTQYIPYNTLNSFTLTAVPLFILMGEVLVASGASAMIYSSVSRLVSFAPGGLLHTNIVACALFAAVSGSSPATAATIGSVAIPEIRRRGYDDKLTLGSLAAGGTLGILIPPSINMIVFAVLTESSVGRLFAGGVMPGIVISGLFMTYIAVRVLNNRSLAPKEAQDTGLGSLLRGLVGLWPLLVLAIVVLGGIFGGVMTPTEAAGVGVTAAVIISLVLRKFSLDLLKNSLKNAARTTSMVLFILVGASILSSFLSRANVPMWVSGLVASYNVSGATFLIYVCALYFVLGCFIDPVSFMVLTMPTILPLIQSFGFDTIWFGIIVIILSEIAMLTPPMGINLYVIQGISQRSLSVVIRGSAPFFLIMLASLVLFFRFPAIVLWLPNLIYG